LLGAIDQWDYNKAMLNPFARILEHNTRLIVLIIMCFGFVCSFGCRQTDHAHEPNGFQVERIAHAGGGYEGRDYTNSYQALTANLKLGFVYFEVDFVFTSDNHLVCLHDWGDEFKRIFGARAEPLPSQKQFEILAAEHPEFTNCTAQGLAEWMLQNPSAVIITDVKDNNLVALSDLHSIIPDPDRRLIPQIYQPEEYAEVKALGFQQLIWTLYRFNGGDEAVIAQVAEMQSPVAVTMPTQRAETGLALSLKNLGIPTYVHTINDLAESERFLSKLNVSEIYTDFLSPEDTVESRR
jgi:glycerophosphoryl diester phosphodiesterase